MVPAIIDFALAVRRDFAIAPGHVLEVGSYNVNGSIRAAFQPGAASYIGIDVSPGAGVDRVLNAHDIDRVWAPQTFDTVLCCEMLEHDPRPWISVAQMHAVLKPGGTLFVSAPTFGFPLHRFPRDYYRFGEDAFREFIFAGLDVLRLAEIRDHVGDPILCCVGRKGPENR